jgi:hypothetical protein
MHTQHTQTNIYTYKYRCVYTHTQTHRAPIDRCLETSQAPHVYAYIEGTKTIAQTNNTRRSNSFPPPRGSMQEA